MESKNNLEVNQLTSLRAESWQCFPTYISKMPQSVICIQLGLGTNLDMHTHVGLEKCGETKLAS